MRNFNKLEYWQVITFVFENAKNSESNPFYSESLHDSFKRYR